MVGACGWRVPVVLGVVMTMMLLFSMVAPMMVASQFCSVAQFNGAMPWSVTATARASAAAIDALTAACVSDIASAPASSSSSSAAIARHCVKDVVTWCRGQMRRRHGAEGVPTARGGGGEASFGECGKYVAGWLVLQLHYPVLSFDVMSALLPVAFQLADDFVPLHEVRVDGCAVVLCSCCHHCRCVCCRVSTQWIGVSALEHLFRHSLATDLREHRAIIVEVCRRLSRRAAAPARHARPCAAGPQPHPRV